MKRAARILLSALFCLVITACGSNDMEKTCNVLVLHRMDSLYHRSSVYDRVFEMCVPVQMKGASKRKTSADNKIKLLRELNNRED